MPKTPSPRRAEQVANLYSSGLPVRVIAQRLELKPNRVSVLLCEARKSGLLPKFESSGFHRVANRMYYSKRRLGSMRDVFEGLTRAEADWLINECPEELTLAEFITSLIRDAAAGE